MIYLDTSALAKLFTDEVETQDLRIWLQHHKAKGDHVVTSDLTRVELMRAAARSADFGDIDRARRLLATIDTIPLSEKIIATAEVIGPPQLRSLDAIHLAAATQIRHQLTAVVAYDHRLLAACLSEGLPVQSPGENGS